MVDFSLQKIARTRTSKLKFADTMRIELVEWLDHNQTTTTHADFSYFYMRTDVGRYMNMCISFDLILA